MDRDEDIQKKVLAKLGMERLMAEVAQRPIREAELAELERRHRRFLLRERARMQQAIRNAQRERTWCVDVMNLRLPVCCC